MPDSDKHGMFDSLLGKGEAALDKFMDDPEKVAKAKEKAEGILRKHMDQQQAESITNTVEDALKSFADRNEQR